MKLKQKICMISFVAVVLWGISSCELVNLVDNTDGEFGAHVSIVNNADIILNDNQRFTTFKATITGDSAEDNPNVSVKIDANKKGDFDLVWFESTVLTLTLSEVEYIHGGITTKVDNLESMDVIFDISSIKHGENAKIVITADSSSSGFFNYAFSIE